MGRRRNARSSKKNQRRLAGLEAQRHLGSIMASPDLHHPLVVKSAAIHLIKTSQRHRLPVPREVSDRVCRKCWCLHVDSGSFRVRIKAGQRIKTCLKCGSVRRFGGGPKHHRIQQRGAAHE